MSIRRTFCWSALFLSLALVLVCTNNDKLANGGNGSGEDNARVVGKLTDGTGRPVSGALVRVFGVDYVPSLGTAKIQAAQVETTDAEGTYRIEQINPGVYNIEGEGDTLGVFIDSIEVPADTTRVHVPAAAMKKYGTITGISHMVGQNELNQVRITYYIPGTNWIVIPGIGGRVRFQQIPEGQYQVIAKPDLDNYFVDVIDTSVAAGDTTDLDTFYVYSDQVTGKPIPNAGADTTVSIRDAITLHGSVRDTLGHIGKMEWAIGNTDSFRITPTGETAFVAPESPDTVICLFRVTDNDGNVEADTLRVFITWDAPLVSISGSSTLAINTPATFTAQTSQSFGSIAKYRWGTSLIPGFTDSMGSTFTYSVLVETTFVVRLEVTDDDGNISTATKTVVITNDTPVITGLRDTAISINDVINFSVDASDSNGVIQTYYWNFGDGSANQYDTTTSPSIAHQFPSTAMVCTVSVAAGDSFGKLSTRTARISVLLDPPVADAGPDTTVSINDTVLVHASGSDAYGRIEKYRFDVNGDGFFEDSLVTAGTKSFVASSTPGDYRVVVKATDDDEVSGVDTMVVHVLLDPPAANAGPDTIISIGGEVSLHGMGAQEFGTIVRYEWKFGSEPWVITRGSDTSVIAPITEQSWQCSVRVTDDDGNTSTDGKTIIVFVPGMVVAAAHYHSHIVKVDGTLWACGWNGNGELGNGTEEDQSTLIQIMTDVRNVTAGDNHSLILRNNWTLWACGGGFAPTPAQIMTDVKTMAAGNGFSLIVKADGNLWVCGDNSHGQLGDGTTASHMTPVQVMTNVAGVAAGEQHSLILRADSTLWACGSNAHGQLGDGTKTDRYTPVLVMTNVRAMAASFHSLVVKADGTLWSFGENTYGKLGDGTTTDRATPQQIMSEVQSVAAGRNHSLMLRTDGALFGCGYGSNGELLGWEGTSPMQLRTEVLAMAAGYYFSSLLMKNGSVASYGRNTFGQTNGNFP